MSDLNEVVKVLQAHFPGFKGAVIFTEKDGRPLANPLFETTENTNVQTLVDKLREWSAACNYMANDISVKVGLSKQGRKN